MEVVGLVVPDECREGWEEARWDGEESRSRAGSEGGEAKSWRESSWQREVRFLVGPVGEGGEWNVASTAAGEDEVVRVCERPLS